MAKKDFHDDISKLDAEIAKHRAALAGKAEAAMIPKPRKEKKKEKPVPKPKIDKEILSAERELKRTWKGRDALAFLMRYFVAYAVALVVMAFLGGSWKSLVVVLVFSLFIEIFCNKHHKGHAGHSFIVLGLSILVLAGISTVFNDYFTIILTALYAVSFVVASALYFHHKGREFSTELHASFRRTFGVSFYSHTIAFATAMLVAHLLHYVVIWDSFVTVTYILFAWLLVPIFVYLFLNKFLYLRFFDRKHVKKDLLRALVRGAIYSVVLIVMIMFVYLLAAMNVTLTQAQDYTEKYDQAMGELAAAQLELASTEITPSASVLSELTVTKELVFAAGDVIELIKEEKDALKKRSFTIMTYFSDEYYRNVLDDVYTANMLLAYKNDLLAAKDILLAEHAALKDEVTQEEIERYMLELQQEVLENYRAYEESENLVAFKNAIYANPNSYSVLIEQTPLAGVTVLAHNGYNFFNPNSLFEATVMDTVRHTVLFRDTLLFMAREAEFATRELNNPLIIEQLYLNWEEDESFVSKALRYRVILRDMDATKDVFVG